jgi:hypothetical protein
MSEPILSRLRPAGAGVRVIERDEPHRTAVFEVCDEARPGVRSADLDFPGARLAREHDEIWRIQEGLDFPETVYDRVL